MFYNVLWMAAPMHTHAHTPFNTAPHTHAHTPFLAGSVTEPHLQSYPGRGISISTHETFELNSGPEAVLVFSFPSSS